MEKCLITHYFSVVIAIIIVSLLIVLSIEDCIETYM